jgi:hypothetical protein
MMKLGTLVCCVLFAFAANCQTKEAEFKKLDNLLKKSNGLATNDFKIISQVVTENSVQLDFSTGGKNGTIAYTNLNWDGFSYTIEKLEGSDKISRLVISFDGDVDITSYENKKQIDKDADDEMQVFIYNADVRSVEQQLEELRSFTWRSLAELRTADKAALIRFISKNLNASIEDENGKIKDINSCEITFAYGDKEITVPTKKLKLHSKEFISEFYLICFGKGKSEIKIKEGSATRNLNVEHPDIELNFEDDADSIEPVEYAIKRLSAFCGS